VQVVDEIEEGRIGPVRVLDADDQRPAPGQGLEQPADRPGRLLGRHPGIHLAQRRCDALGRQRPLALAPQQGREAGLNVLAREPAHDLAERPVGCAFAPVETPADRGRRLSVDTGEQLAGESRLADPGRPEHGDESTRAARCHLFQRLAQPGQLALAPDERAVEPAGDRFRVGSEPEQPPRGVPGRLGVRRPFEQSPRPGREHDLAGLPFPAQSLSLAHDRPARHRRRGLVPDDRLTAGDSDPDAQGHATRLRGPNDAGGLLLHLERRPRGLQRVVFTHRGHAEERDRQRGADALGGGAVPPRNRDQLAREARDETLLRLRVERDAGRRARVDLEHEGGHRLSRRHAARLEARRLEVERGILAEDALLLAPQGGAGLDSELVDQRAPQRAVDGERIGLAPAAVERQRQLRVQTLAERVLGDEGLELGDQARVPAQSELRVDSLLGRRQAQLAEPRRLRRPERAEVDPVEGRPAPERQRLRQAVDPGLELSGSQQLPSAGRAPLEGGEVQIVRIDTQLVARRLRQQHVGSEQLAQPGDVHLERVPGRVGRRLSPEAVDQPIRRDGLVRPEQKQRQETPLLLAADRERAFLAPGYKRAKDGKAHRRLILGAFTHN